jgi:hypothetical protein
MALDLGVRAVIIGRVSRGVHCEFVQALVSFCTDISPTDVDLRVGWTILEEKLVQLMRVRCFGHYGVVKERLLGLGN